MNLIEAIVGRASKILLFVATLCIAAMMLHVCLDVLADNFIGRPIAGTAEIVAFYYMTGAVFLPLPYVEMRNEAIFVDLFFNMGGKRAKRIMLGLAYLAQAIFFVILGWQTGTDAIAAFLKGEVVEAQINVMIWPGRFFLPLAFLLAGVISMLMLLRVLFKPGFDPEETLHGEDHLGGGRAA
ncbi:TRAP transporter small permease [Pseudooceanicola sp.]|uniref:TRAP transporter small permease n=1 Tax=Pseudooceanicola sp. TaxID=1914328 RepID=UPI00261F696F|nr:TRAP transporter small permease [Pseudooceanicola sp.]MDF1855034.1 TRAP transporter small permease [Pseudooceanicola sp.]